MNEKNNNSFRLHVPLDIQIYEKLQRRADKLGFDSVQAYIRFWAKAEVDGRQTHFETPVLGVMSSAAITVITGLFQDHLRAFWNDEVPNFKSIEDAIKYVHDYYHRQIAVVADHQAAQTDLYQE